MKNPKLAILLGLIAFLAFPGLTLAQLPVGTLSHDGPATPEQISLLLPVTGSLPQSATATVRYKQSTSSTWITGHPLHRIRPDFASSGPVTATDAFAWPVIDLNPGTSYDVEVTVTSGAESEVKTATFVTRAIPGPAPASGKVIIAAGSTDDQIESAINNAANGAVIEFQNGTYNLDSNLQITKTASATSPIYIRGQSRDGVIIRRTSGGRIIHFVDEAAHMIFEDMTFQDDGIDSGVSPGSAVSFHSSVTDATNITFRRVTMSGFDRSIISHNEATQLMVYDCTFLGTNQWNQDFYAYGGSGAPGAGDGTPDLHQNLFWNDDGIRLTGQGNVIFNNTFRGFGDTLSFCTHNSADCRGIHFYRNDVYESGDDCTEVDHGFRNLTFYDNRCTNAATFMSFDPMYGGPFLGARNIAINNVRSSFKQNSSVTGQFIYNNTIVLTNHRHSESTGAAWIQFNNGALRAWGYRNNILVFHGTGFPYWMEATVNDPIDFTHNSWYPDGNFRWNNSGGSFDSLADVQSNISTTTPLFSGATRRHENDNIVSSQPFTSTITLGPDHLTQVTTPYEPRLKASSPARGSGVVIPNITDGFSGGAPDRGAIITGRPGVTYGDRSASGSATPNNPTNLRLKN